MINLITNTLQNHGQKKKENKTNNKNNNNKTNKDHKYSKPEHPSTADPPPQAQQASYASNPVNGFGKSEISCDNLQPGPVVRFGKQY